MKNVFNSIRNRRSRILAGLLLISLSGCSGLDNDDATLQYIQVTFSHPDSTEHYKIEDFSAFPGAVYYKPPIASFLANADSLGFTSAGLFDFSGSIPFHISVSFTGNSEGTFYWNSDSLESTYIFQKNQEEFGILFRMLEGYTNVTKYGAIGERLKGRFFGTVLNTETADTVILDGDFSVIRGKDFSINQP